MGDFLLGGLVGFVLFWGGYLWFVLLFGLVLVWFFFFPAVGKAKTKCELEDEVCSKCMSMCVLCV